MKQNFNKLSRVAVELVKFYNHSGGCPGADMAWETEGDKQGIETIAYSFHNHVQESKNPKILTIEELSEGFEHVKIASKSLKRNIYNLYPYVRNLLSRNWFQVKNSEKVFAVGKFMDKSKKYVSGGTGWAVQMAVDNKKTVYLFDQEETKSWFKYNYETSQFEPIEGVPLLSTHFAGIGTRELNEYGLYAIQRVIENNFEL
jgi:hypothetical protein